MVTALLIGLLGQAGPTVEYGLRVNTASFDSEFGDQNRGWVRRIALMAGRSWFAQAGDDSFFRDLGETAETTCQKLPGDPGFVVLLRGIQGCHPIHGCFSGTLAEAITNGSCMEVRVYLGEAAFQLPTALVDNHGEPNVSVLDWSQSFQHVVMHELGHTIGLAHVQTDQGCVMFPNTAGLFHPGHCEAEVAALGFRGTGYLLRRRAPIGQYASQFWSVQGNPQHLHLANLGSVRRAPGEVRVWATQFTMSAGIMQTDLPNPLLANYNYGSSMVGSGGGFRPPAVAYDSLRDTEWMFVVRDNGVHVWSRTYASTWAASFSFEGVLTDRFVNGDIAVPTRSPVGVAYDATTDRIVIAFVSSSSDRPKTNAVAGCQGQFGCLGDVSVKTVPASAAFSTWNDAPASNSVRLGAGWAGPNYYAYNGQGAPSVACNLGAFQVIVNGTDVGRWLYALPFQVQPFVGQGVYNTGGYGNWPIVQVFSALAQRFAAVTQGANDTVYVADRPAWYQVYWGWQATGLACRRGPAAGFGTSTDEGLEVYYAQ